MGGKGQLVLVEIQDDRLAPLTRWQRTAELCDIEHVGHQEGIDSPVKHSRGFHALHQHQ